MNVIKRTKPPGQKWNRLLDIACTIIQYKKITIDHSICIKVFSDLTVPYLTSSTDNVLNNNNDEKSFTEIRKVS